MLESRAALQTLPGAINRIKPANDNKIAAGPPTIRPGPLAPHLPIILILKTALNQHPKADKILNRHMLPHPHQIALHINPIRQFIDVGQ